MAYARQSNIVPDEPLPGGGERPCSACGRPFLQTLRRRMLCKRCYYREPIEAWDFTAVEPDRRRAPRYAGAA